MESKHLVYLSIILEKGSITAAAEHLNIAQPTLTRAMATLEMQVGTQLFTRSRFGVSSTPVGESLAREGRAITRRLDSAKEQVSQYKLGIKHNLRIASGSLFAMEILPIIIEKMLEKHPEIAITATCLNPAIALEGLIDDQFDIIIAPQSTDKTAPTLHKEIIIKDKVGIFCGKNHPLAYEKNIKINDFIEQDWLSLGIASYFEKQTTEMLISYGIHGMKTKVVFRNDAIMLIKMLSTGRYLAALPSFPVSTIQKHYPIIEIKMNDVTPINRDLYLWCAKSIKDYTAYLSFRNIVRSVFNDLSKSNEVEKIEGK